MGDKITGEDIAKAIADNWATKGTGDAYSDTYGVEAKAEQNGAKVTFTMDKAPSTAWLVTGS